LLKKLLLTLPALVPLQTAAEEAITLPGIVITASRLPVHTSATGANTTRIERDDIERMAPSTTADLLRGLPNVHISRSAGATYAHLRGGDPNHTVILIDGVQVNDPTDVRGGAFDLGSIDPSEIERLEILRGAGSSAHGSDAMAGVIHIHTRQTERPWLKAEGGRLGFGALAAGAGSTVGRASVAVGVHDRRGGRALDAHDYHTRGGHVQATLADSTLGSLRLTARLTDDERASHPEGSGGALAVLKDLETRDGRQLQLGARATRTVAVHTSLEAWIAFARQQTDVVSPGAIDTANPFASVPASRVDSDFRRMTAGLSWRRSVSGFRLLTSVEWEVEDGEDQGGIDLGAPRLTPTAFDIRRQSRALAFELLRQGNALSLHAALRLDRGEDFNAEWSPRLGARYQIPSTGTLLSLSWTQAFKQPSLYAIGNPLVGNADLNAETSWTIDAGVTQSTASGRLVLELNGFHTRYRELIDFDFESFRLLNRSRVHTEGIELTAAALLSAALSLNGTASLTSSEIQATGRALLERPQWIVDTALEWESHQRRARLRLSIVDEIPSASVTTGPRRLDSYARIDVAASMPLTERFRLRAAVDNLFNTDYDDAVGIKAAGILPRIRLLGQL